MTPRLLVPILAACLGLSSALAQQPTYTSNLPDSILAPGEPLLWLARVQRYCEGPVYDPADGMVYFTEQVSNAQHWPIWRVDTKAATPQGTVWVQQAMQANGLEFDPQGRLVAAQNGRFTRYTKAGAVDSVLVTSGKNGVNFNQANDLTMLKNGSFYFTDLRDSVYYLDSARNLKAVIHINQPTQTGSANGLQFIEEENALYVNAGTAMKKCVRNPNGSFASPVSVLQSSLQDADGSDIDSHGNWYIANYGAGEIRVFNAGGTLLGRITLTPASGYDASGGVRGNTSNCAFGGPDGKTLYITGDGGLYALKLKIPGRVRPWNGNVSSLVFSAKKKPAMNRQGAREWVWAQNPSYFLGRQQGVPVPYTIARENSRNP